eukprot:CAMPEP_0177669402 /NCGR_PEP_ID=MMETSP0447-20121125/23426_1 /TAXON_ID=0 /ORGANISM="Stygamoeba regulata, Strain BSH-02190019" /LENGTH=41 /DNA_ID=CAMNT_0019176275 /DNA_START=344 /DNA_END=466 /DNA_ORIENTATION=+
MGMLDRLLLKTDAPASTMVALRLTRTTSAPARAASRSSSSL